MNSFRHPALEQSLPFRFGRFDQRTSSKHSRAAQFGIFASTLLVLFLLMPYCALAQQASALNGAVTDESGGVVPNAQVTLTNAAQGTVFKAVTNASGEYSLPALEAGTYDMRVTAAGYKAFQAEGIVLRVARTERVDAKLTVGDVSAEISVTGTDLGAIQTESPEISTTITEKQISQIVLNGRNFTQLVTLSPGISNQTGQDEGETGVAGSVEYSINGGRPEYNNWELDGASIMDNGSNSTLNVYPNVDAIAETEVLTSNYGAQYGRNASGTVLAQTKSGTEHFHGDVFEFLRNDAFNARNYFETSVPEYKKHDFGFTVGGPVFIPRMYNTDKKKTFFFYSQEFRREIVPGQVFSQPVPSDAERNGDFSDFCPQILNGQPDYSNCPVDPNTGTYYPSNQVPIDPNGKALLVLIPAATSGSGTSSIYQSAPAQLTTNREELFKIDHTFNDKLRGFYRFIYDSWSQASPTPTFQGNPFPTVQNSFVGPGIDMVVNLTYTASPSLVNEFVADYTTDHITLLNISHGIGRQDFTGNGFFDNGYGGVLPSISVGGGTAYGGGFGVSTGYFPWQNSNPTYSYRDDLTKTLKNHTLIFGASYIAAQKNEPSVGFNQGSFSFSTSSAVTTNNAFADLLTGKVGAFSQTSAQPKYYNRYEILEPYFQDNWRVNPKLTVNLGVRLSLFGTYHDISNQSGNFEPATWSLAKAPQIDIDGSITGQSGAIVPGTGDLFNGVVRCGLNHVYAGCMTGHLFNPAPRVGFAYDVFGNGKLSVRGGYGVFFEHTNGNESNSEVLEGTAPVVQTPNKYNFIGYDNAGGSGLQFPLSMIAIPTHATWPYVQQFNLAIQGELPSHTVMQAAYVGSVSRHLPIRHELNQLAPLSAAENPYKPGQTISNDDCTNGTVNGQPVNDNVEAHLQIACGNDAAPYRPFYGINGIDQINNVGQAEYDSLQVSLSRYFGHLNGSLAYTWSHAIDDGSDGTFTEVINGLYPKGSLASANFDQRHLLEVSLVYDLPIFQKKGLLHSILGGWEISDLTGFQTGAPFSIANSTIGDNAGTGNTVSTVTSYPDIVGPIHGKVRIQHPTNAPGPRLYNSDAFANPQGLTYGNAGRNVLNLPSHTNFDMGLFKNFAVTENTRFEFRAEGFNVFNHTQWSGVDTSACYVTPSDDCSGSTFLTATSAHNARILQLAGKFVF